MIFQWNWNHWSSIPLISLKIPTTKHPSVSPIKATVDSTDRTQELTARERRQLRQERRESKAGYSWREEVEERLIKKPKKAKVSAGEARNLDTLADLGPQWYAVRVSRVRGEETAALIARLLARNYPHLEFKTSKQGVDGGKDFRKRVHAPSVKVKTKLKNGTISVKSKPVYPGCVFLWCVLNKELHDFIIEECAGVGGFIGSKVGNNKRQINRPRPVDVEDMEEIFRQAKEEQAKYDREFEEKQQKEVVNSLKLDDNDVNESATDPKSTRGSKNIADPPRKKTSKLPTTGSTVRVVSGTYAEFVGILKKLNRKTGKATVGITLFGKETSVELDRHEIVPESD